MKANSDKSKKSNKATRRVLAGVLCGASVLSLVLSLVMPPISQAIANDVQTVSTEETVMGGGSSSESTDVDNTNNGDTERQDNNDVKNDEDSGDAGAASLLSDDAGVEDAVQPADDSANDEGDIALAVEDADGYTQINTAQDLYDYLQNDKKTGKFRLNADVEYASDITLGAGEVTLDLNGHKIKHNGTESGRNNMSMFNVPAGATLTIEDLQQAADNKFEQGGDKNGNLAKLDYDGTTPSKLTYYVTESTSSDTATTETLFKHEVAINGAIVGTTAHSTMRLINVCGGTFNLQSGVLTTNQDANVRHLIYADNGSTVNMSGGYVCGASMGRDGAGAGIHVEGEGSTLVISDGVIAGNYAPSGGGVYARNSTVNMVGGIISGNGTNNDQSGYGAGICAENSNVTITNGHITNNRYQHYIDEEGSTKHLGNGCHGGGGIAAWNGGSLTIVGGYITGNYSAEAGGGVYAGVWNSALSGFTFSGGIIASNVAQNSEGGGIRISAPTKGVFEVPIDSHADSHAYITNNTTNTTNDWGGGGVFVQGGSDGVQPASLRISNALITNNSAEGYGGGFAACPTGKTAITDTNGIAIFGNRDENGRNLSGGTGGKSEDRDKGTEGTVGEITENFKNGGHKDLFLIHQSGNTDYIAAVTGQMLGGGAANWSGTIDDAPTSIGKYEGAQAKYMIGLKSEPIQEDMDAATAAASLFITGNRSNIHGGGIMTNGDVIAGSTTQVNVYPKMKLNGTKALTGRALKDGEFKFQLLKQGTKKQDPSFADHKLQLNGCTKVGNGVKNDAGGNFFFDLGRVYSDGVIVYYLVEDPGNMDPGDKPVPGVTYDQTIYKIEFKTTKLKEQSVLGITYTYYSVNEAKVTNVTDPTKGSSMATVQSDGSNVSINLTTEKTFTNKYAPKGSWTPQVTKKVVGGELKKFKFELANDENFTNPETGTVDPSKATPDENKTAPVEFVTKDYLLKDLENGSKTFTYYVREQDESTTYPHYKFDRSVYRFDVTMKDQKDGTITATKVTYTQIKDADGNTIDEGKQTPVDYNDGSDTTKPKSTPTFTNTYSTSLPLSGMSGVTLTYLAGAAVLCAAAAWMHIRRKANAKGGERRE